MVSFGTETNRPSVPAYAPLICRCTQTNIKEKYLPEIWTQDINTNVVHSGMDELMINDFFRCLDKGLSMPIDVYDAASWMAVSALSEESIRRGGAPVSFPDFTGGRWMLQV